MGRGTQGLRDREGRARPDILAAMTRPWDRLARRLREQTRAEDHPSNMDQLTALGRFAHCYGS